MGNFLVGTLRFFPAPLARAGFPVLVLETRMADVGQLFGQAIFEDAIQDVDAAVTWLREQGFDTIVLSGYSSGATLATRYAATHHVPDLRALVCLGNPWGLPQSMQERAERFGARPPYEELARTVEEALGDDPDASDLDRLFLVERSRGPSETPARQRGLHLPHLVALARARRRTGDGPPPDRAGAGADPAGAGHR